MSTRSTIIDTVLEHWYYDCSEYHTSPSGDGSYRDGLYLDIDQKSLKRCVLEGDVWSVELKDCELAEKIKTKSFKIPKADVIYFEWMAEGPFMAVNPWSKTAKWIETLK